MGAPLEAEYELQLMEKAGPLKWQMEPWSWQVDFGVGDAHLELVGAHQGLGMDPKCWWMDHWCWRGVPQELGDGPQMLVCVQLGMRVYPRSWWGHLGRSMGPERTSPMWGIGGRDRPPGGGGGRHQGAVGKETVHS